MSQLKEDEWPAEGEPTTTNRQQPPGSPREEHSPTPRHSHITGNGVDTQDTEPTQPALPLDDAPEPPPAAS